MDRCVLSWYTGPRGNLCFQEEICCSLLFSFRKWTLRPPVNFNYSAHGNTRRAACFRYGYTLRMDKHRMWFKIHIICMEYWIRSYHLTFPPSLTLSRCLSSSFTLSFPSSLFLSLPLYFFLSPPHTSPPTHHTHSSSSRVSPSGILFESGLCLTTVNHYCDSINLTMAQSTTTTTTAGPTKGERGGIVCNGQSGQYGT